MFVLPKFRGQRIGEMILGRLMEVLSSKGIRFARLETGYKHEAAMSLYGKSGFKIRDRFGSYPPNPHSVFMEKEL